MTAKARVRKQLKQQKRLKKEKIDERRTKAAEEARYSEEDVHSTGTSDPQTLHGSPQPE